MKRVMVAATLLVVVVLMMQCTTGLDGGGGSEITNGKLVGISGAPLAGITVDAYPDTYIHGKTSVSSIKQAVTAADGTFELAIDSGYYNLYVVDTATGSGVCVRDIGAKMQLGTICLDTLGAIAGTVRVADSSKYHPILFVFCAGTPLRSSIASGDSAFSFEFVPSGRYPLSLAILPLTGCAPGEDCNPAGTPLAMSNPVVRSGATTVVDTLVSLIDIGIVP